MHVYNIMWSTHPSNSFDTNHAVVRIPSQLIWKTLPLISNVWFARAWTLRVGFMIGLWSIIGACLVLIRVVMIRGSSGAALVFSWRTVPTPTWSSFASGWTFAVSSASSRILIIVLVLGSSPSGRLEGGGVRIKGKSSTPTFILFPIIHQRWEAGLGSGRTWRKW